MTGEEAWSWREEYDWGKAEEEEDAAGGKADK